MVKRQTIRGLLLATRPKTLPAGICPVLLGTALARDAGRLHLPSALACLVGAVFIQIGTNYANDYFDFVKGTDNADRLGPTRATQAGWVTPRQMLTAFIAAFAAAGVAAVYLSQRGGWGFLLLLGISIVCGILYTAGPLPLGYIGLGDVFAFTFFGPVAAAATYYVQTLTFDWNAVLAGCAPGFFAVAMIDVNNLRDIDTDRRAGKRTPAVLFGRGFARLEYLAAILGAAAMPVWLWLRTGENAGALGTLTFLVPAAIVIQIVFRCTDGETLNRALAMTGLLLLAHTLLFCLGVIL